MHELENQARPPQILETIVYCWQTKKLGKRKPKTKRLRGWILFQKRSGEYILFSPAKKRQRLIEAETEQYLRIKWGV